MMDVVLIGCFLVGMGFGLAVAQCIYLEIIRRIEK